jgi:DNA-binding HxlR family transcriptional regulator
VLSSELKAIAANGLIARSEYGVVPPKMEYRLTPMGRSFIPVIAEIRCGAGGTSAPKTCAWRADRRERADEVFAARSRLLGAT